MINIEFIGFSDQDFVQIFTAIQVKVKKDKTLQKQIIKYHYFSMPNFEKEDLQKEIRITIKGDIDLRNNISKVVQNEKKFYKFNLEITFKPE